jgi:hypothetical protein
MAIIIPYNDPSAHGSIADSVSFRRRFNTVILQKKPHPKQPNTDAQKAQRNLFKTASTDWYSYDAWSKDYFVARGKQLGMTARNLFLSAKLKNIMPSQNPCIGGAADAMQLQNIRATESQGVKWRAYIFISDFDIGWIYDTENIFHKGSEGGNQPLAIRIKALTESVTYHFRDALYLQFRGTTPPTANFIIRVPEFSIAIDEEKWLWVSEDGSVFYDQNLVHLAATNNF